MQELLPRCPTLATTLLIAIASKSSVGPLPGHRIVTFFACSGDQCRSKGQSWGAYAPASSLLEQYCIFCGQQSLDIKTRSSTAPRHTSTSLRSIKCGSDNCGDLTKVSGLNEDLRKINKEFKCSACGGGHLMTWLGHAPFDESKTKAWKKRMARQMAEAAEGGLSGEDTDANAASDWVNVPAW